MPRRIAFLVFPRFQLLDAAGPISAFEIAGRIRPGTYELRVIAAVPGSVASSSGERPGRRRVDRRAHRRRR